MTQMRGVLGIVLALAVCVPSRAAADDLDAQAKALLTDYRKELKASRDISDGPGWGAFRRRLEILRKLGPMACPRARAGLLRTARKGKRIDDRLLAARGLAQHGDLDTVKQLLEALDKKEHAVLTQVAAEALAANTESGVQAWLATAPAHVKSPGALAVVLRAGQAVSIDASLLAAAFDAHVDKPASIDLAYDALHALGHATGPEATVRILAAAGHSDPRLRIAAADVLPSQPRTPALDAATRKLLNDDVALVRYAMLMALGAAKALHFVPEISERLGDDDRRTRKTALDVLKRISGKDFGFDAGAWRRWHEKADSTAKPGTRTVVTYHGVPVWSDRLAFILDKSGSMGWPFDPDVTTRMAVAKAELQRVLGVLPKRTLFNVLAFDGKVSSWRKSEAVADEKTVVSASRWVAKQESERGAFTNTHGVLEQTLLQNPRIDTVFLLSDGIPEWGDIVSREGLLAAVRDWNRYRRITIHAFAITHMFLNPGKYERTASMNRAQQFMRELAAVGGGRYRLVSRPK